MSDERNHLGQAVGYAVNDWRPPPLPSREPLEGRHCRLEPLEASRQAPSLYEANSLDAQGANWTYLPYGPFVSFEEYLAWLSKASAGDDPLFFAIVDPARERATGVASFMRVTPAAGTLEIGHLNFSPLLQRTPAATEAMFLMIRHAFRLGYRRCEWKCDALNAASRSAARRLGFSFEGVFRQAAIVKGRNRDTAWHAITDKDWLALESAFERWLAPANFDARGRQVTSLSSLTAPLLHRPEV